MGLKRYRCTTSTRTTPTTAEGQRIGRRRGEAMGSDAAVANKSDKIDMVKIQEQLVDAVREAVHASRRDV